MSKIKNVGDDSRYLTSKWPPTQVSNLPDPHRHLFQINTMHDMSAHRKTSQVSAAIQL